MHVVVVCLRFGVRRAVFVVLVCVGLLFVGVLVCCLSLFVVWCLVFDVCLLCVVSCLLFVVHYL